MKTIIASLMLLSFCGIASANHVWFEYVPYEAPAADYAYSIAQFEEEQWWTFDLVVHVDAGDSWTVAYFDVTADEFFVHPNGGNIPAPENFEYFGLAQYDSFWTSSEEYPNPDVDSDAVATTFAPGSPMASSSTRMEAEWYVDPEAPNVGEGVWTIARFTVPHGTLGYVEGEVYYESGGGAAFPVTLIFPEPTSLALLAAGGLALLRRR